MLPPACWHSVTQMQTKKVPEIFEAATPRKNSSGADYEAVSLRANQYRQRHHPDDGVQFIRQQAGREFQPTSRRRPARVQATRALHGVEAFNHMIGLAMKWAPDAQPARLEAVLTPETTGQNGKATIWRGYFASPGPRAVKTIVCSGSRRPDAPTRRHSELRPRAMMVPTTPMLRISPSYHFWRRPTPIKPSRSRSNTGGRHHQERRATTGHIRSTQRPQAERTRLVSHLRHQRA
jgi:hypothetical protein